MLLTPEFRPLQRVAFIFTDAELEYDEMYSGEHVYSAVPCAISADEIIEIERLVRETRLTYSMGETGYYRAPAIYCREQFKKGAFGKFVYAEAQYNHDIRNIEQSFRSSGGEMIKRDYATAIQNIADSAGFDETSPIQPTDRLPKEFEGIPNKHNGTHHFLIDDFCRAYETGKLSPTNIWAVARYNIPGLIAHKSALMGGVALDVPDLGDPPADWELLYSE